MPGVFKRKTDKRRKGAAYGIWWRDGNRRCFGTGFADKEQSLILARRLDDECARRAAGLIDPAAEQHAHSASRSLADHIAEYLGRLEAKGDTPGHVTETRSYLDRVIGAFGWKRLADIDASVLQLHLSEVRKAKGLSSRTFNAYVVAWRGFGRWLAAQHRWPHDPLASLARAREGADRRRVRRVLTHDQLATLIQATERGPVIAGLSGADRAMLYRVLVTTGLRRSEATTLTRASFDLQGPDGPAVTVEAAYSKRRRRDTLPLPDEMAVALRSWLGSKTLGRPLWALPDKPVEAILRPDLASAGLDYAIVQRVDGIDVTHVLDFHSFRHGYCTDLARSGASVKVLTDLARHSDPRLTLRTYARIGLSDQRAAVNAAFGSVGRASSDRAERVG